MRTMDFKMERPGLVEEGQKVELSEGVLPGSFYYTIEPSVAMSGNFPLDQRTGARSGTVTKVERNERGYYVTVALDEAGPAAQ